MKKKLAILIIFLNTAVIWIWLIDFTGLQSIRFYCYDHRFCNPIAQVIENPFWQKLFPTTKVFDPFFWPLTLTKPKIPEEKIYRLIIQNNDLQNLINNLPANPKGYLTSKYKKTQPATLTYLDRQYPVKVRFRGISYNHWLYPKKSWRVNLQSPSVIRGENILDFVIPEDKNFYVYFAATSYAQALDLLLPHPSLSYLSVNNGPPRPYLLLEAVGTDFLERRRLAPGWLFADRDPYPDMPPLYESIRGWKTVEKLDNTNYLDLVPIAALIQLIHKDDDTIRQQLPQLVNMPSFYKWQALAMLIGNRLEDDHHNALIYQNPTNGLLEFIPADIGIDTRRIFAEAELPTFDQPYNPLVSRILSIPEFKQERDKLLKSFVDNRSHLTDALTAIDIESQQAQSKIILDTDKNLSNISYFVETRRVKQALAVRFNHIARVLK